MTMIAPETATGAEDGHGANASDDMNTAPSDAARLHQLAQSPDRAERARAWLELQSALVPGAVQATLWEVENGARRAIAFWPQPGDLAAGSDALEQTAALALREGRPVARAAAPAVAGQTSLPTVALPVVLTSPGAADKPGAPRLGAVVAIMLGPLPSAGLARAAATEAVRRLQWGSGWLVAELHDRNQTSGLSADTRARVALDVLSDVLEHEGFSEAAMAAATELAIRTDCSRVSVGFRRRGSVRVAAISHSARFGEQLSIARGIGAAMDEAIDQRATILYPEPGDRPVATTAHAALARLRGGGTTLTIPMFIGDRFIGAFTFERSDTVPFAPATMALLDAVVALLSPVLEDKRLNDRWLGAKLADAAMQTLRNLVGPGHPVLKLGAILALAAVTFLSFATGSYRVNADATLQGKERRAITAAYDGFIQSSDVRAGDIVKAGQLLAKLDDRDFVLERLRRETEREQYQHQYDDALAARQPSLANVVRSQIAQSDAQIKLIDEQIARTRLTAPFDGVVISGDLTQRAGDAVSRGDVLFEVAPLTGYRVEMNVDEREVAALASGQPGDIVFTALPGDSFAIAVRSVTPVAQAQSGRNLFRVEADLVGSPDTATAPDGEFARLRPGMTGVAKIPVRQEHLITIWTRPMANWLRLQWWKWLG